MSETVTEMSKSWDISMQNGGAGSKLGAMKMLVQYVNYYLLLVAIEITDCSIFVEGFI